MELELRTTKPSQITLKTKLFPQSSLESKHSFSSSLDVVDEEMYSYRNLQETIENLGIYRALRPKCKVKDENEDDLRRRVSVQEWNSMIICIMSSMVKDENEDDLLPDHDELDEEEQEIMGVAGKPSRLKTLLYLILTVSSLILCFLPRFYGDKIPNLFHPCPWVFYGFNFSLMLAAAASLVSIDTMSNIKKVAHCFSNLAIFSILTALVLFLFSSFLWARCLWDI